MDKPRETAGHTATPVVLKALPDLLLDSDNELDMDAPACTSSAELRASAADIAALPAGPSLLLAASLAHYHFLDCLDRCPLGEIWKVQAPSGQVQLAHFLPPWPGANPQRVFHQLAEFRHRGLAPFQLLQRDNQQTILLTDLHGQTLKERFQECWAQGLPGIPREELLGYLRMAAVTLDTMYMNFQVQHLMLNPRNLLLQGDRLQLAGFGLVEVLWLPTRQPVGPLNPRYAAPELFKKRHSPLCDQYSLALIFAEMCTGMHPWRATYQDGLKGLRRKGKLDLSLLSNPDRAILTRALSPLPDERFANSIELIGALEGAGKPSEPAPPHFPAPLQPVILYPGESFAGGVRRYHASLDDFIADLLVLATGATQVKETPRFRYILDRECLLEHHFPLAGPVTMEHLHLEGFKHLGQPQALSHDPALLLFRVTLAPSFWQRLIGRRIGLEVRLELRPPQGPEWVGGEVVVRIRPFGCSGRQAVQLLTREGPRILESLRDQLKALPEQRAGERLICSQPLVVLPVIGGNLLDEPLHAVTKDVSPTGIGFYVHRLIKASDVYVNLPETPELANFAGLAHVVRKQQRGEGWFEIGATFQQMEKR